MMLEDSLVVQILNYQRIKKAHLEFVPGLNVIIGDSNNGKSSILRGLETAIYNISREGHVTLGETKSAVGIKYRGHEVIWRRDTNAASQVTYRVDGKVYAKLGRTQPTVVKEALGLSEVEVNDRKFRINFSKQMSYPFLLDSTPSELFKFIVQSSEEDNVVDVLQTMKSDTNEIASNVKKYDEARNALSEAYNREAQKYKAKKLYMGVCDEVIDLDSKVKMYQTLKDLCDTYEKCDYVVTKMESRKEVIENVLQGLESLITKLTKQVSDCEVLASSVESYDTQKQGLEDINSAITYLEIFLKQVQDLDSYKELLDGLDNKVTTKNLLKSVVENYEVKSNEYQGILSEIEAKKQDLDRKERVSTVLGQVLTSLSEKESLRDTLSKTMQEFIEQEQRQMDLEKECQSLENVIDEIECQIKEIGVCPYCGSDISGGSHEHS